MPEETSNSHSLKSYKWQISYKTSSAGPQAEPVNILHDFYIPVLKRSIRYDRVAGYFSSSSLAAASQGFSAFTNAGGRMRLIVGADLNPDDVAAILAGDRARLAERLRDEITLSNKWPQDVTRGVELLAWMVSRGVLDIRVGFRVHGDTGAPLDFTSTIDGYVHEKWALFSDARANRLYISGSLNESQQAMVHNAENIDVHADWWDGFERQRVDAAENDFARLWNDANPHIKVLTLPQAIEKQLINMGQHVTFPLEIDGTSAHRPSVEPPPLIERLKFHLIKHAPNLPNGRYVGMATAPVKPWPHQEMVAKRLIQTWPYAYLLCDEVGLGKTIEAGLAIRSLYLSGLVKRVLIAPPASLTQQWQREMASKFFLPFARVIGGGALKHEYIFPKETTSAGEPMYAPDLCIVSTGLLSRKQRLPDLQKAPLFDLALVDEAHYARRQNPKQGERRNPVFGYLYQAIDRCLQRQSKCLWLATATPMQLDWIEVFDLIALTGRAAHFQNDPTLTRAYYRILGRLLQDLEVTEDEWGFLRRAIASIESYDPFLWRYINDAVMDGRIRLAARKWLQQDRIPKGVDRKRMPRLIFAAAPLSRVMLRHTRDLLEIYKKKGQLGANLAQRKILPTPQIVLEGVEKQTYQALERYCRDLTQQLAANSQGKTWKKSLGFYLSFLRLRLASSIHALRETLTRRRERVIATRQLMHPARANDTESADVDDLYGVSEELDENVINTLLKNRTPRDLDWEKERLSEMLTPLADLSKPSLKMRELLGVLEKRRRSGGRIRQTVIFTRFLDTLNDIVDRLHHLDPSMRIGSYSGRGGRYVDPTRHDWRNVAREEIKHRFLREAIDILVCTDAAAEGLNLQTADMIINYDLPWNPMKVEQRIGRIDRIGQKYERVDVLNLCYLDSAEQIVYDRLLTRLAQAGDVVGAQQIALLPVVEDEFDQLASGALSEATLMKRAQARIKRRRQRTASMEMPAAELYEIYRRMQDDLSAPIDLEAIWEALTHSTYLRDLGCRVSPDHACLELRGVDGIADNTLLTIDRALYEQRLPDHPGPLGFASYGDPVFDRLMEHLTSFELPDRILPLTEGVEDLAVEVMGFGVKAIDSHGKSVARLITRYSDLQGLVMDDAAVWDEAVAATLKRRLHDQVRDEFEPTRGIERLIADNERAGQAQALLSLIIADRLFPGFNETEQDNFWQTVKIKDERIAQRDRLIIPDMPTNLVSKVQKELLLDIPLPQVGEAVSPTLPIVLVQSAVDAACRIADGMKVKKTDLTIGKLKTRLAAAIKRRFLMMH